MKLLERNFDRTHLAIVSAMTLGDKSLIDKDVKEDYSLTGASHVLAVVWFTSDNTIRIAGFSYWVGVERLFPRLFRGGGM